MSASTSISLPIIAMLLVVGDARADNGITIDFDTVPTVHFPAGERIVHAYPAFEDYMFMFFDVCDAMGFSVEKECNVYPLNADLGGNALATIVEGNRVIVYDRELSPLVGSDGAEMIIAHELGHHHCGHIGTPVDPQKELQADAFAGAAAKLMGKSLDYALSFVPIFAERPSLTHPGKASRVGAITAGWQNPTEARTCNLFRTN